MEYILSHLPQSLIVLGLILLAIEVIVLGFSTFVLFFMGIGSIATGALMSFGLFEATILNSLLSIAIISTLVAIFSWKPMKNMQNKVEVTQVDNGMIGHQFTITETLNIGQTITHHYSGITWKVKSKEQINAGTEVEITEMQVGLLTVKSV